MPVSDRRRRPDLGRGVCVRDLCRAPAAAAAGDDDGAAAGGQDTGEDSAAAGCEIHFTVDDLHGRGIVFEGKSRWLDKFVADEIGSVPVTTTFGGKEPILVLIVDHGGIGRFPLARQLQLEAVRYIDGVTEGRWGSRRISCHVFEWRKSDEAKHPPKDMIGSFPR